MDEKHTCPACSMPRTTWPDDGVKKDGVAFCCQGCADGGICTVMRADGDDTPALTDEEIRSDRASGDFVQSLQRERKTVSIEDYGTDAVTKAPPRTGGVH